MEQAAGGAGEMNSPLLAVPSLGDRSREAPRLWQLCRGTRNESSVWRGVAWHGTELNLGLW